MEFCKAFNAQTQSDTGTVIPVVITVYEDRSFTFITKTPPAAVLIKQAIGTREGLRRAATATRSARSPRPAARDRRDEDAGPERQRRRRRRRRSSRAPRARWAWRSWRDGQARQALRRGAARRSTASASTRPPRRSRWSRSSSRRQVRRVGRGARPHRPQRPPRRRAAARHDRAAATASARTSRSPSSPRATRPREAEEAGADVVGGEDLAKRIEEGFDDFDVAIATPDLMPVVGRLGRILGPEGKMPNPKVGTVTMDVAKAVEESKAGKVEYRTDRTAIVHLVIGKAQLRRAPAARELRGGDRGADPRQAVGGQGPLHPLDHARHDDGARRQGRPGAHARHRRGGAASPRSGYTAASTLPETPGGVSSGSPGQAEPADGPRRAPPACGLVHFESDD